MNEIRSGEIEGCHIRCARLACGINQAELARRIGISRTYLSQIEGGKARHFSYEIGRRLADFVSERLTGEQTQDDLVGEGRVDNGWAIVELFGHQQIAGLVSEQVVAGASFVRVDVPGGDGREPYTKFYGAGAIYAITPTTEEIATVAARALDVRPVSPWLVPDGALRLAGPDEDGEGLEDHLCPYCGERGARFNEDVQLYCIHCLEVL